MTRSTGHPQLLRDASPMMDELIHTLTAQGYSFALLNTQFRFDQQSVRVQPAKDDRDVVFGAAIEAFAVGGWHYSSTLEDASVDPSRPVVSMTFRHPIQNTRLGEPTPPRPARVGFEINMPDSSLPLSREVIEYYSNYALELTRSILETRARLESPGKPLLPFGVPADDDDED